MLCSHAFQPSFGALVDLHWPVRSLWPHARPLLFPQEMMLRGMHEVRSGLRLLDTLHRQILDEVDKVPPVSAAESLCCQMDKDGQSFALNLDTKDFSPDELSVKQVGRKLMVSGKTEKKLEDGNGSYSYRYQEFRQDLVLPEGVNPDAVSCSLVDGRLQIRAPKVALPEVTERVLPINTDTVVTASASQNVPTKDNAANLAMERDSAKA